jgi:hypothetical protein
MESLFELCLRVGSLTMNDIRRLHLARFSIINPLSNKIDQMVSQQWYNGRFWIGGVSDALPVDSIPERSAFLIMIYWELFGGTLRAYLEPELALPKFDLSIRLDYIRHCITSGVISTDSDGEEIYSDDQKTVRHVVGGARWERLWQTPMLEAGPNFEEGWRQNLWLNACQSFGLDGMEMIKDVKDPSTRDSRYSMSQTVQPDQVLNQEWRQQLIRIREQIEQLDSARHRPKIVNVGFWPWELSEAPDIAEEASI